MRVCCFQITLKVWWCVILKHLVHDVFLYKHLQSWQVMMHSVLKSVQIFVMWCIPAFTHLCLLLIIINYFW